MSVLLEFSSYGRRVTRITQGGKLAHTHEGKPGLPRGRSRLPATAVRASQRERLLRAVVAAAAESGYAAVTVAGIVRRARVSRAAFYQHFGGKEDCFLAATGEGWRVAADRLTAAARAVPADAPPEEHLRASLGTLLGFLAAEPAFARVFYVEMPAAGGPAMERVHAARQQSADFTRRWHERARVRSPDWPDVPGDAYLALAGATAELIRSHVHAGRTAELSGVEDTLVSLHLAVLASRPWGST